MYVSIGVLAKIIGVCVATLRRWDRHGTLKPQARTAGGHRRYKLDAVLKGFSGSIDEPKIETTNRLVIGYARVSAHDQKDDLIRQEQRLAAQLAPFPHAMTISDLGSGLNFKKRGLSKLISLIQQGRVAKIYVTHKDRLLRFGTELIEAMLHFYGGELIVLEDTKASDEIELAKDVLSIITVFSAKLYGKRAHRKHVAA